MRKILLKIVTKIILKNFPEGVKPIYGSNEWSNRIIAYQWTWKNEDTSETKKKKKGIVFKNAKR